MKSIKQHVLEWLDSMRVRNLSPKTIQSYEYRSRRFTGYLAGKNVEDLRLVDRDRVKRFWHGLVTGKTKYSANSLGVECRAIKSLFAYMNESGAMAHDPSSVLVDPSSKKNLPIPSPKQVDVMKVLGQPDDTVQGIRDKAWLYLIFSSAIRVSECEGLLLGDLSLEDGILRVRGKGKRERLCPVGASACAMLKRYLEESRPFYRIVCKQDLDHLFLSRFGGRLRSGDIRKCMQLYRDKAGVSNLATPHGLRRAAATGMISRAGKTAADIGAVGQLLGHTRLDVTARYAQVLAEDLGDVHQRSHPLAMKKAKEADKPTIRTRPIHV